MAKGKKILFGVITIIFTLFFVILGLLFFNKNKTSANTNAKIPLNNEVKLRFP